VSFHDNISRASHFLLQPNTYLQITSNASKLSAAHLVVLQALLVIGPLGSTLLPFKTTLQKHHATKLQSKSTLSLSPEQIHRASLSYPYSFPASLGLKLTSYSCYSLATATTLARSSRCRLLRSIVVHMIRQPQNASRGAPWRSLASTSLLLRHSRMLARPGVSDSLASATITAHNVS
jgi:hypothetical protein